MVLNLLRKLFLILARSLSPVGLNFGLLEDPSLSATNLLNSFFSSSSMSRDLIISSMSASSLPLPGRMKGLLVLNFGLCLGRKGILGLCFSPEVSTIFSCWSGWLGWLGWSDWPAAGGCEVVVVEESLTRGLTRGRRMEFFRLSSVLNRLGLFSRRRLLVSTDWESGAASVVLWSAVSLIRSSETMASNMEVSAAEMLGPLGPLAALAPLLTSLSISFSASSLSLLAGFSLGIRLRNLSRPRDVVLRLSLSPVSNKSSLALSELPSDFSSVSRAPSFNNPLSFSICRNPLKSPPPVLGSSLILECLSGTDWN